jgi:hypothetical protein
MSGTVVIDLEISEAHDAVVFFDVPVFCIFGATPEDVAGVAQDKCFAFNDGGSYRFKLDRDSRYVQVTPGAGGSWVLKVTVS